MKQKDSLNKRLNTRLASLVMLSVLSVPWVASAAGNSVVANNMLPGNGKQGDVIAGNIEGGFNGSWTQGNQMNLHQMTQNAIVTWDSFSIGANATVTIRGDHDNFNMLNYVTGSESSQIYGKLNSYVGDKQGGNIYLVNPNGVQIGNSAEINVGSLHIANKKIDNINRWNENTDIANALKQNKAMTNAELMSLGYINANKLVFEGERVVIDMDRLSGLDKTKADALTIVSKPYDGKSVADNRKYDIVLGSSTPEKAAEWGKYMVFTDVSDNGGTMDTTTSTSWHGTTNVGNPDAPNQSVTEFFTYRWIKDGKELENIGKKQGWGMGDHYALRYSIDLTGSDQTPIGTEDNAFKGKFDGLDNSIFGLSIDNRDNKKGKATGLFGFTDGAIMGNVTLIAGTDGISIHGGATDTGAFIGHAVNTTVKGVNSTLKVSGTNNVGGIIGYAKDDTGRTYSFADASGSVQPDSRSSELSNLTNTGNISGVSNVGGLVGYMDGGKLSNDEENRIQYKGSYNFGKITGIYNGTNYSSNIGGLIGKAENATVGGTKHAMINYNTVEGGYNVGGIVGSAINTTVANVSNEGAVKANGYTIDSYIYHTDNSGWKNNDDSALPGTHKAEVRAANVGGIVGSSAGSELKDVTNKADVSSALVKKTTGKNDPSDFDHYAAGNVGGIVGRAEDSNITNVNNVESNIRGAMNVGGIAGYFGSTDATNTNKKDYRILNAINNGGDIMATGGIKKDGSFTLEKTHQESYITGNIGGIAGYLYGVPVHIEAGGNRGDVHTAADTSKLTSQAVNVGGIVGKIDMPKKTDSNGERLTDDKRLAIIKGIATDAAGKSGYASAAVSSSYNTGNVTGYTNIGGIGGFAYNGSIAGSYNVGDIKTTRNNAKVSSVTPINMGGILGESTEMAIGRVIIYDTYNKGTIGDSSYSNFGRHVGGIVGRLSGIVEKSYNNGDIYNGFNVVGGIVGYWYSGYLKNVFNTGNITVFNKNSATSQVGGIVGSVDLSGGNLTSGTNADLSISNAYNLGSLRSFKGLGNNEVGGIVGATYRYNNKTTSRLKISNAYTMGNMYVNGSGFIGDIVGVYESGTINKNPVDYDKVYYIRPQTDNGYIDLTSAPSNLRLQKKAKVINYKDLTDKSKWGDFSFSTQKDGKITEDNDDNWRMSNGASLPMLNAFLSGSHKYFSDDNNWQKFMENNEGANVQYGTAYDPLLTIIKTKKDLSFNWSDMDLKNNGSLAVFGLPNADNTLRYTPGLTLNNVEITNSTHIFGGTIYSDGLLELNAKDNLQSGLRFGMDSMLYGSDVVLNTNSSMELSGSVISTGNHNALSTFNPEKSLQHGINISAGDLTVYGKLITMGKENEGTEVIVPGINYGYVDSLAPDKDKMSDKTKAMTSQGMTHAYRLQTATAKTGDITISTMENTLDDGTYMSGSANLLYGNYKKGKIDTKGNLTVSSSGDILVDSDLDIAGSINLSGADVPDEPGTVYVNDITLDLSNIGGELTGNDKVKALHKFIDAHTTKATGIYGSNNSELTDDKRSMKITFDLWDDYTVGGIQGNLNFDKNDLTENGTTVKVADKLKNLYVKSAGTTYNGSNIRDVIYTWISNAEELNSLQRVAENLTDRDALSYNYVLKNDIDASGKSTYNTIGSGDKSFRGTFDGDGHTIVGLQANGGIFGKLGSGAVVKDINIVSSVFTGKETDASVGAVAAENNGGKISGISGYGNTVKGGGYIGGLVCKNYGGISNSDDQSTVIAGANTVAGGIAGINGTDADNWLVGTLENVQSNSAVTTGNLDAGQYASNLGGIVGKNEELFWMSWTTYNINNVSAHGVTGKDGNTKTSGGIVGTNEGSISNAYNESIIHGSKNIGGIAGSNAMAKPNDSSGQIATLENIANAVEIIGDAGSQNVGGLVGMQEHATTNQGRNTGAITGCTNVGGMVGYNTAASYLNNLENSPQATITGITNVGGIAGVNEGVISADDQLNLLNSGKIYGWENVGGIAGKNSGKIDNVNSNINLYVIDEATRTALKGNTVITPNAQFFGGVTGENVGIITNATNRARVDAAQASYVGGIVGKNTKDGDKVGQLLGMGNSNEGFVIGKNYVGGVIGKNEVDITGTAEQSVGIVNSGTVIALAGGAGGIIGENSADITHVIMKNEGEVHGNASIEGSTEENGTGGIIGVNGYKADGAGANISNSSLMNRVNGNVSGVANVGGIIGINHGIITGARDDNNNYYKYQIYNNGTIQAGSYDATNGTITAGAGENIGGLLGNNRGTLTAGYNTGVVKAGQSSNVGGIAGTNSGTLDQVFNSVVTVTKTETGATDANGRKLYNYTYTDGGAISGASNVGGIVGSNTAEGQLSNAYSTTAVAGNSNVANIVGSNAGQVSNIYGYAANRNTNVTNVNGGTVRNSYIIKEDGTLQNGNDAKKLNSYDFDDKDRTWKLYDKRTNPLLKVFLTKVTVDGDLQNGWVYDATNHLDIPGWIANGKLTTNDPANDAFKAYKNNSSLLQGEALKNVGDYSSWLWSGQIASGGDVGPNNLGYDFTVGDITVTKKVLNVTGNTVNRTYGDLLKNHDYALSIDGFKGFNDAMQKELNGKVIITDSQNKIQNNQDTGIITVGDEKRTNNKRTYNWQAGVKLDDSLIGNYEFQNDGVSSTTTTVHGVSNVLARKVHLNNINASTKYGSKEGLKADGNVSLKENSIVYGDQVSLKDGASVSYKADGEYAANKGGRDTADAGEYKKNVVVTGAELVGNELGNYELVNNATGVITVKKATLNVGLNDVVRTYGDTSFTDGTGYGIKDHNALVNGDKGTVSLNKDAITDGGLVDNNSKTNNKGDYKWNVVENGIVADGVTNFAKNYDIQVTAGNSKVNAKKIYLNNINASTTYGSKEGLKADRNVSLQDNSIVYGDQVSLKDGASVSYKADGEYAANKGDRDTADAGTYKADVAVTGAELVGNELGNYELVNNATGVITVKKATLNVGLNDVVRTYGNATITSGGYSAGNITGLVNGDSYNAGDVKVTVTGDGAIAGVSGSKVTNDAGNYEWTGSASTTNAGLDKNYNLVVTANGKSMVEKATLNVGLNDVVRTYGNATITSGGYSAGNITGLVNGDSYDASAITVNKTSDGATDGVSGSKVTNDAGKYEWTGSASTTNAGLGKNYNLVVNGNGKSTVKKANLVVNLNDITRVYGNLDAKNYSNAYTFGANAGLVNGDNGLVINANKDGAIAGGTLTNVEKTNNVGNYEWNGTASGVDNLNTNYDVTVNAGKSDVTKANLVVNLNDITRVYGNMEAKDYRNAFTFGANAGLVNGDNGLVINADKDGAITGGTLTNVKKTNNVGSYEWNGTASGVENLNTNYDVQINAGKSDVTKANLVVNLNDITRVYGNLEAKNYSNAFTFGENAGLVNGDNGLVINADKDGAIAGGTLTNVEKTNNVGSYKWNGTASGVENLNTNYDVTVNAGNSDVTKAKLVVNLNDITRVYGNLDAKNYSNAFTFGANAGLVNGDNGLVINADKDGAIAEGSVSDVKKTNNVGKYEWNGTASGVENLNTNYDVQINAGKSDVTKANIVVNLNDITRVYGNLEAKNYSNAFTFGNNAGLVNGDSGLVINADKDGAIAEGSVSDVKKTNNVGKYEWNGTASGVDNLNTNYDVQINAGKSDVTKANLVVNLNDITRVYGNLDAKDYSKAFTFGANAGLVNGDNGLVINADKDCAITGGTLTNVEKTNNVGSYEWNGTASGVDNLNTNYAVTVNAGKSDVTKANLVVNLKDITRVYGNMEAKDYRNAFTFGANAGLVNGDNGLVIDANADGAITGGTLTNVKKTNNVGSYEWNGTASGVDNLNTNYNVQINAGKSDVTKANLVVNLNDITRVYGNMEAKDYRNAFTFGANAGLVNGDNGLVINADKDGAIAGGTLTNVEKTNNVGKYEWNGTASGVENLNTNYAVTVNAGKSNVTKANLVVNLNDITRVYGNLDAKNYSNAYTFGANAGLVNGDNGLVINADKDGAIAEGSVSDVKKTNNVGKYEWNGTASGVENLNTNYAVTVNAGKSNVTKANLVVNLNDITRVYGNLDAKDYSNAFTFGNNAGLVNGDNGLVINADKDGAIVGGTLTNVEKTNNVGSYEWNGTASGVDNLNTNYDVTVNAGKSDVTPAKLTFVVDDKTITQGVPAKYTGKANGLTNGDTLAGIGVGGYDLDSSVNPLIVGVYEDKIGVLINGSVHLTGGDGLLKNYKVEIDPGTLTVLASFNPADDYWFGTAPWDKERNLRERKAEFHYVAGGMSL